ncbi:MAG: 30S ribosomal protein S19e [Candidatus Altiarchaeales archaeon]|nr:MAG: 30S ribosomal protein S19e [Candidatus Altiarchaeales archaeon]
MTTVYEIPPDKMIEIVANDLKNNVKLKMPEWAKFVKTGAHRERMPQNDDWWWIRSASILRKIYINGPVGVQRLRTAYGGKKNRGVKPEKFYRAGGKIIRSILQEFDRIGFTEKVNNGRKITPKGQSYLDKLATEISRKSK